MKISKLVNLWQFYNGPLWQLPISHSWQGGRWAASRLRAISRRPGGRNIDAFSQYPKLYHRQIYSFKSSS